MGTTGARVKRLREYLKLSQGEFAEKLGMKQSLLSYIESDKRNVTDKMMSAMYACFKARPEWVLNGDGAMIDGVVTVEIPESRSMTDLEVLEVILITIENYLYSRNKYLEPVKKAKLILSFYKYYLETDKMDLKAFRKRIKESMDVVNAMME